MNYPQTTTSPFTGDIVITNGGNAGIGTTDPGEVLQVNGNIRVDDGTGFPGLNRVWATEKVFNVLDYGAVPIEGRAGAFGSTASIDAATDQITQTNPAGAFANAQVGDTLWVLNGANFGRYTITQLINTNTVQVSAFAVSQGTGDVRWKVTAGMPADCTDEFTDAIEAAHAAGGGVVYVPAGYFLFTDNITVLGNVTLQGMCKGPHTWSKQAWERHTGQGPVLLPTANEGSPNADAFITMEDADRSINAAIDGLTIFYPNQRITGNSTFLNVTVAEYPFCIEIGTLNINDIRVSNMLLVNPYQGIRTPEETTQRFGRLTISNIRGCPLFNGLWLDGLFDVSYIEEILFSPVTLYDFDSPAAGTTIEDKDWNTFVALNLTAIHVLHAEFAVVRNVFAWIADRGLIIDGSAGGSAVFMGENIQFDCVNIGIEALAGSVHLTNIKIQASQPLAAIVNNSFSYGDMYGILAGSGVNSADLHIIGGSIGAAGTQCVRWERPGRIELINIEFINSSAISAMTDGILVNNGRANVVGCRFIGGTNGYTNCINITNAADQGVIYGNDFFNNAANTIGINNAANDGFNVFGSVGIGTTAPAQTLDLVGNAIIRGADGWDSSGDEARLNFGDTTQQVRAVFGTGLVFQTDTADNNGFFWRSSANADLMCLAANGSLGIGTTAPAQTLDLVGNAIIRGAEGWDSSGDEARLNFGDTIQQIRAIFGTGLVFQTDTADNNSFFWGSGSNANLMCLTANGSLGIGTTNPGTKLEIKDDTADKVVLHVKGNPYEWNEYVSVADFSNDSDSYNTLPKTGIGFEVKYNSSGTLAGLGSIIVGKANNTDGNLDGYMAFTVRSNSQMAERVRIDKDGNVGIGTTAPDNKLDVRGGYIHTSDDGTTTAFLEGAPDAVYLGIDGSGLVCIGNNPHWIALNIDSDGNVGIGVTTPNTKFDIAGNAQIYGDSWASTGDEAILNLGFGSHGIKAKYGTGVQISASGAAEAVTILETTGNVGIGVTGPTAKLDVDPGTVSDSSPNMRLRGVTSTVPSGGQNGDIQVYVSGTTRRLYIKISGTWRYAALT
jgi:hypothetical protein